MTDEAARRSGSPFLEGYEHLQRQYGLDYAQVSARHPDDAAMRAWFGAGMRGEARFVHVQSLDFDSVRGRLLSSSSAPLAGHPRHAPMLAALRELFDATSSDGRIDMEYDTRLFLGSLERPG